MEVTYGLLSNLVQTKSIDRVLAPIASQISLLIILNESQEGQGSPPGDMTCCAEAVMQASEILITVARQRGQSASDPEFQTQMNNACEILDLATSNLCLASQEMETEYHSQEVRNRVVTAAKDVLQGTMKVLLVSDDAEVRRIMSAANLATEKVAVLNSVKTMPELVMNFKTFTETLMVLTTLANKRQKDLCHARQREKLITALSVLKKSIPSISLAVQSYVKYPSNPQAQASKSYVVSQVLSAVREIMEAVENRFMEEDYLDSEEPGFFVVKIEQMLDAVSEDSRLELHDDVESWTEAIVRHSMLVAHLCLDEYRDMIVKTCQRLLQVKGRVIQLYRNMKSNPELTKLREDYEEVCETFIDEFCELEKNVNVALLHLVVDVFKETTEPLERLVKAATYSGQNCNLSEEDITEFGDHADSMCRIASFAAASCTDARRVRSIRTCVSRLESLDPEIVPAAISLSRNPQNKMAIRHVKLLMKEWIFELSSLLQVVDEMTDPRMFVHVSEIKLQEDSSACKGFLLARDVAELSMILRSITGRARRVAHVAEKKIDGHHDPVFRNGLLVYLKQLHKAITAVRAAGGHVINDMRDASAKDTLLRRLESLLEAVYNLKAGFSKGNQPDLLSPVRRNARDRMADIIGKKAMHLQGSQFHFSKSSGAQLASVSRQNRFLGPDPLRRMAPPDKIVTKAVVDKGLVKLLSAKALSKDITTAATRGDKHRVNMLGGDLLGWTNHIVEAADCVALHCGEEDKKSNLKNLIFQVDQLAPQVIDKAKYLALGDVEETEPVHQLCDEWCGKIEKLRVMVDATTDKWKLLVDRVCESADAGNMQELKAALESIDEHQKAVYDLVTLAERLGADSQLLDQDRIFMMQEDKDDLENLTVTLKTTADMVLHSGSEEEKVQLDQLGREWAVKIYSVVAKVEVISQDVLTLGRKRNVWYCAAQIETKMGVDMVKTVQKENIRLKELLVRASAGDEAKLKTSTALCTDMASTLDEIKSTSQSRKVLAASQKSAIDASYTPQRLRLLLGKWIIKAVQAMEMVHEVSVHYHKVLNKLSDLAFALRSAESDSEKKLRLSEFQLHVSQFSESMMAVRQRVLQGIQISSDLENRAAVRRSLDSITGFSPTVIDTIKILADDDDDGNGQLLEFSKQKYEWAVRARHLIITLQQTADLKPSLLTDITRLLGADRSSLLVTPSQVTPSILPAVSSSSTTTSTDSWVTVRDRPRDTPKSGTTSLVPPALKPTKLRFNTLQEEMDKRARAKPDLGLESYERLQKSDVSYSSPYRPSTSILAAAKYLQTEAERWEDDHNPIVKVAKEMCTQLRQMGEYLKGEGPITHHKQMIKTAKDVAENGKKMLKFATLLAKHCVDLRFAKDLLFYANQIPTVSTQLNIIASVQLCTPDDRQADKILVQNAQNLMKIVRQTLKAAEAVCVKGLQPVDSEGEDGNAVVLATQWQRKLLNHRLTEANNPRKNDLGLRRVEEHKPPTLSELCER